MVSFETIVTMKQQPRQADDFLETNAPTSHGGFHEMTDADWHLAPMSLKTQQYIYEWYYGIGQFAQSSMELYEDMSQGIDEQWDQGVFGKAFVYGLASPFYRLAEGKWYSSPRTGPRHGGKAPLVPHNYHHGERQRRKKEIRRPRRPKRAKRRTWSNYGVSWPQSW